MSEETEKPSAAASVLQIFDDRKTMLENVLAKQIDVEQFLVVVKNAITKTPGLLECIPVTLLNCVVDAASLGLSVDPRAGEFWLIPRNNRNLGGKEATGMIGWRGFVRLAKRAGVKRMVSSVVYRSELDLGLVHLDKATMQLEHKQDWSGEVNRDPSEIVGAYAACWLEGDERPAAIEALTEDELVKRKSKAQSPAIWNQWPVEMRRKTVIRALFQRGAVALSEPVSTPKQITITTPQITLGDALALDDKFSKQEEAEVEAITVEAGSISEPTTPPVVAADEVVEE